MPVLESKVDRKSAEFAANAAASARVNVAILRMKLLPLVVITGLETGILRKKFQMNL